MSDSVRPHRRQPTRLPRLWDSPGKNTGVGCHFLLQCMEVKSESEVAQSCQTLRDPVDCSLPGSSIHGIFQARVLEWGAIASLISCSKLYKINLPSMIFIRWSLTALTKCEFNSNYVQTASKTFKYSCRTLTEESLKYKDIFICEIFNKLKLSHFPLSLYILKWTQK